MIIGFTGKLQSGKTTCAKYTGLPIYSFANPIKSILILMGWDGNKDEKGRKFMQELGDVGRNYDPLLWIKMFEQSLNAGTITPTFNSKLENNLRYEIWWAWLRKFVADRGESEPENWVCDDCRFDNEAEWIRSKGGVIVEIVRTGFDGNSHISEKGISKHLINATIYNKEDLDRLKDTVDDLLTIIGGK